MSASLSETFLLRLAQGTFLKPWALANTHYASGRELTDLIVAFGDDVLIISDKACDFDQTIDPALAWQRWRAKAITGSLRQLKTARQRIQRAGTTIYVDRRAEQVLPFELGAPERRRYHLVAIARPRRDPEALPTGWPGFTYVSSPTGRPFDMEPMTIAGSPVHVFDGPTIDRLFDELDTAPDVIGYLAGRAMRLAEGGRYAFREANLLGATMMTWDQQAGLSPMPPALSEVGPDDWERYATSARRERSRQLNEDSRLIDRFIDLHDGEFAAGRFTSPHATSYDSHERALRLLAAESRFARRMVTQAFIDIWKDPSQTRFLMSTVPSPSNRRLRYVWMLYPPRPPSVSVEAMEPAVLEYLHMHMIVARGIFPQPLVLGIALPRNEATDQSRFISLFDGSDWTARDFAEARVLQQQGIFADVEATTHVHMP